MKSLIAALVFGFTTLFGYTSPQTPKAKLKCLAAGYQVNSVYHEYSESQLKKQNVVFIDIYSRKLYDPISKSTYSYIGVLKNGFTIFKDGKYFLAVDINTLNNEVVTVLGTMGGNDIPVSVFKCIHKQ